MQRVLEYPRVVKGAASDAHAGAAGLIEHFSGSCWSSDIAVADDGHAPNGANDCPNSGEVYRSAKALLAGATMDEDCRNAYILECAGEVGRGEVLFVPAEAHLGADRDLDGVDHALHEGGGFREFRHHG